MLFISKVYGDQDRRKFIKFEVTSMVVVVVVVVVTIVVLLVVIAAGASIVVVVVWILWTAWSDLAKFRLFYNRLCRPFWWYLKTTVLTVNASKLIDLMLSTSTCEYSRWQEKLWVSVV